MKDIFQDKIASKHDYTQNHFMSVMGLTEREHQRFKVTSDSDAQGGTVYIYDEAQSGLDKLIYTINFSTKEATLAFEAIMEHEVGNWDVEDYYTGENIHRDAQETYARNEMQSIVGAE